VEDVAFTGLATASGATINFGTLTCSSTYCHGNFPGGANASIAWGTAGKLGCTACHGAPPAPSATVHHPSNTSCASCHAGYSATTVTAATHVDGTVQATNKGTCYACHGNATRTGIAGADANVRAAPPIDAQGASATTVRTVGAHQSHVNQKTFRSVPLLCADCHLGNVPAAGDVSHANGTIPALAGALATKANSGWPVPTFTWSGTTCAGTYCHGNIKNGANATPSWTGTFTTTTTLACNSCHGLPPGGSHPTGVTECASCHGAGYPVTLPTAATTFAGNPPALHMNGVQDGGGEPTGGSACSGCHAGIYNGMIASGTAISKHLLGSDAAADTAVTWTSPLTSVAAASRSCTNMCHGDHPHDLVTPLVTTHEYNLYASPGTQASRNAATRSNTTRANSDWSATGGTCVGCHTNPIATGRQSVTAASYSVAAHNGTTTNNGTTTSTWQYTQHDGGVFLRNCTKCHASRGEAQAFVVSTSGGVTSVHFSTDAKLLGGTINPGSAANSTRPAAFVCYNCHGDGTGNMKQLVNKNLWTATTKAFSHPVNMDTKHDTNAESTGAFNSRFNTANRHVNCIDCHDTHVAGRTKVNRTATATATRNQVPAGSPMSGADGINVIAWPALPANCTAAPTGPNACWPATSATNYAAALTPAAYEWQICFKCHTNYAFGLATNSGTFPTAPAGYASGTTSTDLAMDFSPNNRSGHPVVTGLNNYPNSTATPSKGLQASQLLAPWNVNVGTQTMLCTDCHNTDSAAPAVQGPHGSAVRFMLSGTNKAWPYNVAGATSGTLWLMAATETNLNNANGNGLFCRNCHPQMNTTNGLHKQSGLNGGQHKSKDCTWCHIRIPHGGKVSRLFVTPNAPARYKLTTPGMTQWKKQAMGTYTPTTSFTRNGCSDHADVAGEQW
jgi:predicted CxxxxCH...CXXCH cytochrome family protein